MPVAVASTGIPDGFLGNAFTLRNRFTGSIIRPRSNVAVAVMVSIVFLAIEDIDNEVINRVVAKIRHRNMAQQIRFLELEQLIECFMEHLDPELPVANFARLRN